MSVILFNEQEMAEIEGGVLWHSIRGHYEGNIKHIIRYSKQYNDEMKYSAVANKVVDEDEHIKSVVGRLFWYLWIANKTAYALQYQEEPTFFKDVKNIPADFSYDMSSTKLLSELKHLRYNLYTNDGNLFLNKDYEMLFNNIIEGIKDIVISQYTTD